MKVENLIPYVNNPRNNENAVDKVASSIAEFGFKNPIIIDKNNVVVNGHTRLLASKKLGLKEVPVIVIDDLSEAQIKAFRIADNKTSEYAEWNEELLKLELEQLEEMDFNLDDLNIDYSDFDLEIELEDIEFDNKDKIEPSSLVDKFIVPPFSILDTKQGYWQDRKRKWKALGIKSEVGRDVNCNAKISNFKNRDGTPMKSNTIDTGVSIFDPVLCELVYKWFNVDNGVVYDSFAGGSVRGIVAEILGYKYNGIDLRQEQIDANYINANEIGVNPNWICDDSLNVDNYIENNSVDLFFSCPPYADLEVYSDNEKDLSTMEYDKFIEVYREIIKKGCSKLKDDRFAVFVVGEVRDKKGNYYNFVGDTINAFIGAGMNYYNEIILCDAIGTAPFRCGNIFNKSRKTTKVHQNVLVFYKGDPKKIKENYKEIIIEDLDKFVEELGE